MDVRIQAIHFDATEKLETFINRKIDRLVRHYPAINTVEVNLRVVKPETALNKNVIMNVTVPDNATLNADKTANTFEEAVDNCIEAISRQLEKVKDFCVSPKGKQVVD